MITQSNCVVNTMCNDDVTTFGAPIPFTFLCVCNVWQETKEKVKLLMTLADSLVEKGHAHASDIKGWVATADKRYKDFSERMETYRSKLESALGMTQDVSRRRSLSPCITAWERCCCCCASFKKSR